MHSCRILKSVKKCEICSAPASVFVTRILNAQTTEMALCKRCAKERGILDPSAFDLAEKLFPTLSTGTATSPSDLTAQSQSTATAAVSNQPLTKCPTCGFTLEDFKSIGRLGCSNCYNVFMEEILPMLDLSPLDSPTPASLGHESVHVSNEAREHMELSMLEEKIQQAIHQENYEEAAKLRDAINALKSNNE